MVKNFRIPYFFRFIFSERIWGFNSNRSVFLTFDDGPDPDITPWILDVLKEHNVKATFFCVGSNVQKYPELYVRIIEEGHFVGNHTMSHDNAIKVSKTDYFSSIQDAANLIDSDLFRPPYGRLPISYSRKLKSTYKIIMWSWLSYDYDYSVSIEKIIDRMSLIKGGDIIVMHDNQKVKERIKILLPELIVSIQNRRYTFDLIFA